MKKMHLLCNAHLDPAWLWRWNEGLAEAISTFRVAAEFCENYDGFVFNHNEALLYEWVEEHEPALFERIKKLVKTGKWVVIGGWYLQPDCNMISGESFISQIDMGLDYFMEKFGVRPKTAINFDSFGHSRGLVQILVKKGYDGYIFMRPAEFCGDFMWEGCDGSKIHAYGIIGGYNTNKGEALEKVKGHAQKGVELCTWGIGNHGGGPSKIDLEAINEFIKQSDIEIVHSDADRFMHETKPAADKVVSRSLNPRMVGCYTSMVRIKQANRRLENKIAMTEKIMNYAFAAHGEKPATDELKKSKKALAFCQFHDILPGSGIRAVEEDSLKTLGYGEEIADKLFTKSFIKLCSGQAKAKEGEIPIMVFNPHPCEIESEFEAGFMLQNQNWNDGEVTLCRVYDSNGTPVPTQNEKPDCTFNLDWIEKVCFRAKLAPSGITRFDVRLKTVKTDTLKAIENNSPSITVANDRMKASISTKTGLIECYEINGKNYITNGGRLEFYKDNEDPWGMRVNSFEEFDSAFELMCDAETNEFVGYADEKTPNVRIVEDGEVRTKVQAFFKNGRTNAIVEYSLPKMGDYIDIDITVYSQTPNKMLKYHIPTCLDGQPIGETAFGFDNLYDDGTESVFQKWCGIKQPDGKKLFVINDGTYGASFSKSDIKLSLLRTPIYAAHPIRERPIAPHNRFINHIDMGERRFSFRVCVNDDITRTAQNFNQAPYAMSFFPSGNGESKGSTVTVDNPDVIISSFIAGETETAITLYNGAEHENTVVVTLELAGKTQSVTLGKHELKTVKIEN